ncbi:MAG TPA: hypothetical protein VM686_25375 [Polyangiaceae bacterium]|nr:hypothetical protein [Polyangiaceae bacterium]
MIANSCEHAAENPGWTPHALDVVERACAYHGGLGLWRRLRTIRLIPDRLSGLVPWLKGVGRTFPLPEVFEVAPHERIARFIGYPGPEQVGVFQDGGVRIERVDDKVVSTESNNHRSSFRGFSKYRRWSVLDALYFFGYALTHYHSLPFSLLEGRLIRATTSGTSRAPLDVLEIELPADLPTHSRVQRFYFDGEGRLTRHDYHAEIIGCWARGAHFWNRQVRVAGFPVSLERLVLARVGTRTCPLTALRATFLGAEVDVE